jgi:hypothetical protein
MAVSNGWIGHWSPGVGDPTLVGWLTVGFYLLTASMCYRVVRPDHVLRDVLEENEKWLWWMLAIGSLLLAINKQLDLQSALTGIGRMLAVYQGWYETRREMQGWFIAGVGLLALFIIVFATFVAKKAPVSTWLALTGCMFLLVFIFLRAASFHHFDVPINRALGEIWINLIFEVGGLLLMGLGAGLRGRT